MIKFANKNRLLYILAGIVLICYGTAAMLVKSGWKRQTPSIRPKMAKIYKHKKFDISHINTLTIEHCAADVIFKTTGGDSVEIILSGELSPKQLSDYYLVTKLADSVLTVGTPPDKKVPVPLLTFFDENISLSYNLKLEIRLPAAYNKRVILKNATDTRIDKMVLQQLQLDISNGDFQADSLFIDNLKIGQSSGDLDINYLSTGEFEDCSSSGEINIRTLIADSAKITISSGDLKIKNLIAQKTDIAGGSSDLEIEVCKTLLQINNSSGEIAIGGITKSAVINCASGSINVQLDLQTDFSLKAETASGEIENNFYPLTIDEKTQTLLKGSHGKPETSISLTATSGDITIEK